MGEPTVGYILFEDALKFTGDYPEDRHPAQFSVIHIRREVFIPKPVSLTEKCLGSFIPVVIHTGNTGDAHVV